MGVPESLGVAPLPSALPPGPGEGLGLQGWLPSGRDGRGRGWRASGTWARGVGGVPGRGGRGSRAGLATALNPAAAATAAAEDPVSE